MPPHEADARRAIKAYLAQHRQAVPRVLRLAATIGLGIVASYVALILFLEGWHPALAQQALRLLGLTYLAGREPALFAVYHETPPLSVAWAALLSSLDDVATLLLAVPAIWYAFDRLRDLPGLDGFLRSLEKSLAQRRAFLDKWGLAGLVAFLWLPGLGTGPVVAGGMGVLLRIPLQRLLPALAVSAVAVNTFWAVLLFGPAKAAPSGGWWDDLPIAVVAVVVLSTLLAAAMHHRNRFVLVFALPPDVPEDALDERGFHRKADTAAIDVRQVAGRYGLRPRRLAACHAAAEMSLLPSMTPEWAGVLARLGVTGVRDLAVLPQSLLLAAVGGQPTREAEVEAWGRDAREATRREDLPHTGWPQRKP